MRKARLAELQGAQLLHGLTACDCGIGSRAAILVTLAVLVATYPFAPRWCEQISTDAFVGPVAPRVAVLSVGEGNPFGYPVDALVELGTFAEDHPR